MTKQVPPFRPPSDASKRSLRIRLLSLSFDFSQKPLGKSLSLRCIYTKSFQEESKGILSSSHTDTYTHTSPSHTHTHFSLSHTHTLFTDSHTQTLKAMTRARKQEARVCATRVTFEADVLPLPVAVQPQHEVVTPAGLLLEVLAHMGLANKAG
jgi:hypothetical protein